MNRIVLFTVVVLVVLVLSVLLSVFKVSRLVPIREFSTTTAFSLPIQNCAQNKSSGSPSVFWTKENKLHMDVKWRAAVAVQLLEKYGALSNNRAGRIVDMGSGFLALRDAIPEHERHRYVSVDLLERVAGAGTVVCNLNRHEFPMFLDDSKGVAAFCFLGSFEYILDKMTVLHLCRQHAGAHIVMHYQGPRFRITGNYRWVAPLDGPALQEAADIAGYHVDFLAGPQKSPSLSSLQPISAEQFDEQQSEAVYIYFVPK